ncbi:hypothetical protein PV783_09595 [Chitinophaga sp. CC14]|uniref:hypothetical protein n=1 Tax=Chitinophaga sp. CC14 TaxID=3029199 RepID=UPI003B81BD1A
MKRFASLIIIALIYFSGLTVYYFRFIYKTNLWKNIYTRTPEEFVSQVTVEKERYTIDSTRLLRELYDDISSDKLSFYGNFNSETKLLIDSILYSPDQHKLVVLLLAKNPTYQLEKYPKKYKWYYIANCYIGKREGDSFILKHSGPFVGSNFDEWEISDDLKAACFWKNENKSTGSHNMNDSRFWSDHVWNY